MVVVVVAVAAVVVVVVYKSAKYVSCGGVFIVCIKKVRVGSERLKLYLKTASRARNAQV